LHTGARTRKKRRRFCAAEQRTVTRKKQQWRFRAAEVNLEARRNQAGVARMSEATSRIKR
jgi:hypothetical protein